MGLLYINMLFSLQVRLSSELLLVPYRPLLSPASCGFHKINTVGIGYNAAFAIGYNATCGFRKINTVGIGYNEFVFLIIFVLFIHIIYLT